MKREIETHYIFLDTSIFIKENFFAGKKLKAFLTHKKQSQIELVSTSITVEECISKIFELSKQSYSIFQKSFKDIESKAKIFKNIETLNEFFEIQNSFDFVTEMEKLEKQFRKLIFKHFSEIDIDAKNTQKIFEDYFSFSPPFKEGKKKYEFPDAFVLNSLESWCKSNNRKLYVVSEDDDFNSFESDFLIPIKEYDKLLDQISFTFGDENISNKIEEIIKDNEEKILSAVENEFIDKFPNNGYDFNQGFEYDLNSIKSFDGFIEWHSVLQISDNIATVELTIPVNYSADISYDDTNSGWYDREDGRWYGVDRISRTITGKCSLIAIVEIEFSLPGKEAIWKDWELMEISNGIPTDVSID